MYGVRPTHLPWGQLGQAGQEEGVWEVGWLAPDQGVVKLWWNSQAREQFCISPLYYTGRQQISAKLYYI